MAGGENVSVSTQRDTERAAIDLERWELANLPKEEEEELATIYRDRGLSEPLARQSRRNSWLETPFELTPKLSSRSIRTS